MDVLHASARRAGSVVLGVMGLVFSLAGCGAAEDGSAFGTVGPEETLGTATDAVTSLDMPPAAAGQPESNEEWVFAVDTQSRLRALKITFDVFGDPTFGSWTTLGTGFIGPPTAAAYPLAGGALDVYVMGTDSKLYEFWREGPTSDWQKYNISDIAGFGTIAQPPAIVDVGYDWEASVAVRRASDDLLYTLDYTSPTGWMTHKVYNVNTTIIRTTNYVQGTATVPVAADSQQFAAITGKGFSSSEPSTLWIATRPVNSFSSAFRKSSSFPGDATHVFNEGILSGYRRTGSGITYAPADGSNPPWSSVPCGVSGFSATGLPAGRGWAVWEPQVYVRNFDQRLIQLDTNGCTSLGETLTSAPALAKINYASLPTMVYFRGGSGNLWAHRVNPSGHWNLGLALP